MQFWSHHLLIERQNKKLHMETKIEYYIKEIIDFGEPKMDVYEFAIYMYLIRNTRLIGKEEGLFGFKSIRKSMVIGVGVKGTPMSEGICYDKIKSLETKGFIKTVSSEHKGTRIKVFYPSEVNGLNIQMNEIANKITQLSKINQESINPCR